MQKLRGGGENLLHVACIQAETLAVSKARLRLGETLGKGGLRGGG